MDFDTKCVVGIVGLPNRGKTFMSIKLARYLSWLGHETQVFNVNQYKAELMSKAPENDDESFFDLNKVNQSAIEEAVLDLSKYLNHTDTDPNDPEGKVAIYDSLNITNEERDNFEKSLKEKLTCDYYLIWVESVCNKKEVLINNFKTTRENYEEYKDMTGEEACEAFESKIQNLKDEYQTLEMGNPIPFIRIREMGQSCEINKVHGFMATNILKFLCGLRAFPRPIWFSRHGESEFNVKELIGGDSLLSEDGRRYGLCLHKFFREYYKTEKGEAEINNWKKFCSTLLRTQQTISYIDEFGTEEPFVKKELDEINAGICDSMTYEEINKKYPREYDMRLEDKLNYRYPRGESYLDLIARLEPFVLEIESSLKPMFIVSHQATLRCLFAYFEAQKVDTIPFISVPHNTLIKIEPGIMGYKKTTYKFDGETGDYTTKVTKMNFTSELPKRMRFRTREDEVETQEGSPRNQS